jgi:undecaprenyl-diphosphatase
VHDESLEAAADPSVSGETPEDVSREATEDVPPQPGTLLSAHLLGGFAIAALGVLFFFRVAWVVFTRPLLEADGRAQAIAHAMWAPDWTRAMVAASALGRPGTLAILSALVGAVLLRARSHRRLVAFAATMIGGGLLNVVLKEMFQRTRPALFPPIVAAHGFSFPSGHSMGAMLFFVSLSYVAWFSTHATWIRVSVVVASALAVLTIGLSRVYLGVHYLSDVAAGFACGLAWAGISLGATEAWVHLRDARRRRATALPEGSMRALTS